MITPEQAAQELLGTAKDLNEVTGVAMAGLSVLWCKELDTHVMQCVACSWWVEADDVNEDCECSECTPPEGVNRHG